ncbi:hypothetical protein BHM03_00000466 [Ensete ventricosum]|nr:hypothetical protein BHM03_00000466 [Ensete ventricosum]
MSVRHGVAEEPGRPLHQVAKSRYSQLLTGNGGGGIERIREPAECCSMHSSRHHETSQFKLLLQAKTVRASDMAIEEREKKKKKKKTVRACVKILLGIRATIWRLHGRSHHAHPRLRLSLCTATVHTGLEVPCVSTSTLGSSALTSPRSNLLSLHRRQYSELWTLAEKPQHIILDLK